MALLYDAGVLSSEKARVTLFVICAVSLGRWLGGRAPSGDDHEDYEDGDDTRS